MSGGEMYGGIAEGGSSSDAHTQHLRNCIPSGLATISVLHKMVDSYFPQLNGTRTEVERAIQEHPMLFIQYIDIPTGADDGEEFYSEEVDTIARYRNEVQEWIAAAEQCAA